MSTAGGGGKIVLWSTDRRAAADYIDRHLVIWRRALG